MNVRLVIALTVGSMVPAVAGATHMLSTSGDTVIAQSTTGATTTSPGAVTGTGTTTPTSATGGITGAHDAFVLTCVFDVRTSPPPLLVFDASGSGTVPVIAPGTPCSQALGTLLSAGFILASSLPSFDGATQYTLVR